jgi:hypothetical protein
MKLANPVASRCRPGAKDVSDVLIFSVFIFIHKYKQYSLFTGPNGTLDCKYEW